MSTSAIHRPQPSAHIPSLDGIRAIAVSTVFFAHSGLENLVPGGLGVTLFFVLSGYLITTLIRLEYIKRGTVSFRAFYLRRLLRLMPPLLFATALAWLMSALALIHGQFTIGGLLSVLFYYANYFVIAHDFHGVPAGIGVVWSLAVEEHFYLLYPPLVITLLAARQPRLAAVSPVLLCIAILLRRCWLAAHGTSEVYISMATDTRVDAILIGCIMGLLCNPWINKPRLDSKAMIRHTIIAFACLASLLCSLLIRDAWFRLTLRYSMQSMAMAPLIYLAIARSDSIAYRWLNWKPIAYLGAISYSVYLCHHVILFLVANRWPGMSWPASTSIAALLTLVTAAAMHRFIEQPFAVLRRRLHNGGSVHAGASCPVPADIA